MTSSNRATSALGHQPSQVELLLPFAAAGRLDETEAALVARAARTCPDVAADLAAATAEQQAAAQLGEALGRPSARPLLALFAAIDADADLPACNVRRLNLAPLRVAHDVQPWRKKSA